jgi:REP element-mobilizing transposase RayT
VNKRHRSIRLAADAYLNPGDCWLVTIVTADRQPAFSSWALADCVAEQLNWFCRKHGLALYAWVILLDHVHFVVQTEECSTGILAMCQAFKSYTTRIAWDLGIPGKLWQRGFHDHGIRRVEDFDEIVRYVYDNPVRLSLIAEDEPYRWRGGLAFDESGHGFRPKV